MIEDIETALAKFEIAASIHAYACYEGDYRIANKAADALFEVYSFLKSKNAVEELYPFLFNPSDGVRCWAATYLLPIRKREALKVLKRMSKAKCIISLGAEMAIKEWKKGKLNS